MCAAAHLRYEDWRAREMGQATITVERHNLRLISSARSRARQGVTQVLGWRSLTPFAVRPRNKSNAFDTATSHRLLIVQASDAAAREGAQAPGPETSDHNDEGGLANGRSPAEV